MTEPEPEIVEVTLAVRDPVDDAVTVLEAVWEGLWLLDRDCVLDCEGVGE